MTRGWREHAAEVEKQNAAFLEGYDRQRGALQALLEAPQSAKERHLLEVVLKTIRRGELLELSSSGMDPADWYSLKEALCVVRRERAEKELGSDG